MVVETKESKDKEISELKAKIQDYEEKLFVVSKQNVGLSNLE